MLHTHNFIYARRTHKVITSGSKDLKYIKEEQRIEKSLQVFKPGVRLVSKIDPVRIVGMRMCVCPCSRLLKTCGVMWRDIDLI